jgi:hypothetical protein
MSHHVSNGHAIELLAQGLGLYGGAKLPLNGSGTVELILS